MRGWEGLYGRPWGGVVFTQIGSQMNRTRATIKALPTPRPPPSPLRMVRCLFLRVMRIGRPQGSLLSSRNGIIGTRHRLRLSVIGELFYLIVCVRWNPCSSLILTKEARFGNDS